MSIYIAARIRVKYIHTKKIFYKIILTHEARSEEDQFDEKIEVKISWYYPFKCKYFKPTSIPHKMFLNYILLSIFF